MDEQLHEKMEEKQPSGYTSRPAWQIWAARIGLVVFIAFLVLYYINILRGGA